MDIGGKWVRQSILRIIIMKAALLNTYLPATRLFSSNKRVTVQPACSERSNVLALQIRKNIVTHGKR
jgi:hypothetical protein